MEIALSKTLRYVEDHQLDGFDWIRIFHVVSDYPSGHHASLTFIKTTFFNFMARIKPIILCWPLHNTASPKFIGRYAARWDVFITTNF